MLVLGCGFQPSTCAVKSRKFQNLSLNIILKTRWLLSTQMLMSLICSAKLLFKLFPASMMLRVSSCTYILDSRTTSSMAILQSIGSRKCIFLSFNSRETFTILDCTTLESCTFWCWKYTVASIRQSMSRGEQRYELLLLFFIYSTLFFLGLILRQLDLQGTEAPVLDTQYIISMVLVIGSDGISLMLGYLIKFDIFHYIIIQ